jgi:hypothetical protein
MLYLCIPHKQRPWVYGARWLVLAGIVWFQWQSLWRTSSASPAIALAAGLTAVWGVVWSVVWLVLRRPQWDAERIERRGGRNRSIDGSPGDESRGIGRETIDNLRALTENHTEGHRTLSEAQKGTLRKRDFQNGHTKDQKADGHIEANGRAHQVRYSTEDETEGGAQYFWQSYPDKLTDRIHWVMDLIINFRGPGWNWAIPPLPDLPDSVKERLTGPNEKASKRTSSVGFHQYTTRQELFNAQVPQLIIGYFILDIVKMTMMKDPYYILGPTSYALPTHLASLSPIQLRIYRESLSAVAVVVSLQMAFSLVPLSTGLLCGPRVFGQRAEPWYFPSSWGSFSNITDKGLNGLWGGWWHQTFRFAFSAPSNFLVDNGYVEGRSMSAKLLALLFAFGISGFLHTGGSITQVPKTYPWRAPIFFMLQGMGILLQTTTYAIFRSQIEELPKIIRQTGNLIFTFVWLLSTGWILVDDFSRGGIWLYEPIPISPLRGLGFGVEGDGWWCWKHVGIGWYTGEHWWESGIAL